MSYLFLAIAIVAEVIATSALKASDGFSNLLLSIIVVVGYVVSFYCLGLVLKEIPVGVAYAIWCGLGIVLITLVGVFAFGQKLDTGAMVGMAFIIVGVVTINMFSSSVEA